MKKSKFDNVIIPQEEDALWSLYHENSKQNPWYRVRMNSEQMEAYFKKTHLSLPYESEFVRELEFTEDQLQMSLYNAISQRRSSEHMQKVELDFAQISTLLHSGFGITRPNEEPRPLRSVPSGGKLFPLEPYFYISENKSIPAGLYHYNAEKNQIALLKKGKHEFLLEDAMVQKNLVKQSSMMIFITALFKRSTIKYGEKAYRLVLMETGHAAQNINLAAVGLGLSCRNISAFYDRRIESYLEIDGIEQSILYTIALGGNQE